MASSEAVHDLFDILEEDQDELKYTGKELNRYFEQGHLYSMMDEEDLVDDDSSDIQSMEEGEDEVLSQHFSQLSTNNEDEPESSLTMKKRQISTASHPDSVAKKVKLSDDQEMDDGYSEQESIPVYLLPKNKMFHRLVEKVNQAASSIDLEGLRQNCPPQTSDRCSADQQADLSDLSAIWQGGTEGIRTRDHTGRSACLAHTSEISHASGKADPI